MTKPKQPKKVAVDYKSKHFVIQDEDTLDDMDFVNPYINVDVVITETLGSHVKDCMYYGIPAYIGNDEELKKKIKTIEATYLWDDEAKEAAKKIAENEYMNKDNSDYSKHDHRHCWEEEKPPCGQRIKHFECCLCKEPHPEISHQKQLSYEMGVKSERERIEDMIRKARWCNHCQSHYGEDSQCKYDPIAYLLSSLTNNVTEH